MLLKKLATVNALVAERNALSADREGGRCRLNLYLGARLDRSMDDLVWPVIVSELNARIAQLDRRLTELGVDVRAA